MIKCPVCSHENPDGELICSSCGHALDRNTTITTRNLSVSDIKAEVSKHEAHLGKLPPNGLAIYVGQSNEPLIVTAKERLTLGRRRDVALPDLIDLTAYNAYRMGVSRNHAVLTYKDKRLYIHDVGSVNGTWLNGQRLKPYELYALTPGTPVSLGQLTVYIYY
jgi:pSer/pThr/pTyr-binding forkhead associated (FHA) protein